MSISAGERARVRGDANPHARAPSLVLSAEMVRDPRVYACMRDSDGDGKSYLELLHGCRRPNLFSGDDDSKRILNSDASRACHWQHPVMRVLYPVSSNNGTAQFACSCPFQAFLKQVPTHTYMPAGTSCIRVALSNFDPEQDEPIDRPSSIYIPSSLV